MCIRDSKNIVASGVARKCEVQVAYAIGVAQPMGVYINTFGTGQVDDDKLAKYVAQKFDMRPRALIEELDLLRPIYRPTSAYGHFGRSEFSWEKTARAAEIAADLMGVKVKAAAKHAAKGNGSAKLNGHASEKPKTKAKRASKPEAST